MKIKVDVKMNAKALKKLSASQVKALKITTEQMLHEKVTAAEIPFDEGTLQNVQTFPDYKNINKGEAKIVHDTPYARRLYYNPQYNFDQTHNANARGEWWEDYLTGDKKDRPKKIYSQAYKHITGGIVK